MVDARGTAVRDDPSSFCMDWPVFDQEAARSRFRGRIFVLDERGVGVGDAAMDDPGDVAADRALRSIGWTRTSEWRPDDFGRPTARVESTVADGRRWLPAQPIPSLTEEASLHLG